MEENENIKHCDKLDTLYRYGECDDAGVKAEHAVPNPCCHVELLFRQCG